MIIFGSIFRSVGMKRFKLVSKSKPKTARNKPRKKSEPEKFKEAIEEQIRLCKRARRKDGRYKSSRPFPKSWIEDWSDKGYGLVMVPRLRLGKRQIPFWANKNGSPKGTPVDMGQKHPGQAELIDLCERVTEGRYNSRIYIRLREERKKSAAKSKA